MSTPPPTLILSAGTYIVITEDIPGPGDTIAYPRGAVGVIIKSPVHITYAYHVRMVDGTAIRLKRAQFAIHKHYQNPDVPVEYDLFQCVQYRVIVGSRAYGLDDERSDTDRRGFFLPPATLHWSLYGVPEEIDNRTTDETYWELQKFITLALKANPNILECLYSPLVEHATPLAEDLRAIRSIFLSQLVYQTYNGYVLSQFKKMQRDRVNHGTVRWKHAMHLIRLLFAGITALREGTIPLAIPAQRDALLAIKRGERTWDEIEAWRRDLHAEFDAAFAATTLPERPDYARANTFLVKARRRALDDTGT